MSAQTYEFISSFILPIIGTYLVGFSVAVMMEAPRHLLFYPGLICMGGYTAFLLVRDHTSYAIANFLAGLVIAILAQIAARKLKAPVTIFYIPAFYTLVPGIAIYQMALAFINQETSAAMGYMTRALMTSFALGLSIFTIDSAIEIINGYRLSRRKKRE